MKRCSCKSFKLLIEANYCTGDVQNWIYCMFCGKKMKEAQQGKEE